VLTRNHAIVSAAHAFIHQWNEPSCLYHPTTGRRRTFAGTHFRLDEIRLESPPTEARNTGVEYLAISQKRCKIYGRNYDGTLIVLLPMTLSDP